MYTGSMAFITQSVKNQFFQLESHGSQFLGAKKGTFLRISFGKTLLHGEFEKVVQNVFENISRTICHILKVLTDTELAAQGLYSEKSI
jgi:hypothetical protein